MNEMINNLAVTLYSDIEIVPLMLHPNEMADCDVTEHGVDFSPISCMNLTMTTTKMKAFSCLRPHRQQSKMDAISNATALG